MRQSICRWYPEKSDQIFPAVRLFVSDTRLYKSSTRQACDINARKCDVDRFSLPVRAFHKDNTKKANDL